MSTTLSHNFQCEEPSVLLERTSAFLSKGHFIVPFLNPDPYPSGSTDPHDSR